MMFAQYWPLLLPIAAASGWVFGRQEVNTDQEKSSRLSREYYVGLNYLLNEQPDKAVDVFIKLLEVDSETVETHLALGSLFRRRGEVDRAIRIHQNLIARPQLSQSQRVEALMALGRDYMSAGVLDRAERIFQEVVTLGSQQRVPSLHCLLDIYQQEKAWQQATEVVKQLQLVTGQGMHSIIAHHHCELAEEAMRDNRVDDAAVHLKHALSTDKDSVRASLLKANLDVRRGEYKAALKSYKRVCWQDPDYLSEAIEPMVASYEKLGLHDECERHLRELLNDHPRMSILIMLAERIKQSLGIEAAADFVAEQLGEYPSIRGLNKLIEWHIDTTHGKIQSKLEVLYDITSKLVENKPVYLCGQCGYAGKNLHWQCPGCKQWSSMKPIHGLEGD